MPACACSPCACFPYLHNPFCDPTRVLAENHADLGAIVMCEVAAVADLQDHPQGIQDITTRHVHHPDHHQMHVIAEGHAAQGAIVMYKVEEGVGLPVHPKDIQDITTRHVHHHQDHHHHRQQDQYTKPLRNAMILTACT